MKSAGIPFEEFTISVDAETYGLFTIDIELPEKSPEVYGAWERQSVRFIEDAIREKMAKCERDKEKP